MKPCLLSRVSVRNWELSSLLQAHVAFGHGQSKSQPLGKILSCYSQILYGKSKVEKGNTTMAYLVLGSKFQSHLDWFEGATDVFLQRVLQLFSSAPGR